MTSTWLVERYLVDTSVDEIEQFVSSTSGSLDVDHLLSIFVESEGSCFSIYQAPTSTHVVELHRAASAPLHRVVAATLVGVRH